ncbi:hypothetical protein CQA78_31035, partial [Klebsiella pneumoniae]
APKWSPRKSMENAPASLHSLDVKSRDMRGQKYVLQVAPRQSGRPGRAWRTPLPACIRWM